MAKKFIPPTLKKVEDYIRQKALQVDPEFFFEYFTEGEWIDSKGNPVRNWKQKLLTWHRSNILKGKKKYCYCGKPGVYLAGHDDSGFPYFRCVDHKPVQKPILSKSDSEQIVKVVEPEKILDLNEIRNRMIRSLNN